MRTTGVERLVSGRPRSWRFAVPLVVAGLIALGAWIPTLRASATPDLNPISANQLLVNVQESHVVPLSGTVTWTANLGLPSDLTSLADGGGQSVQTDTGFDPTTLLSGSHQIEVWENGGSQQRLALPRTLGETDFIHNGDQAWIWDSSNQQVTHLVSASSGQDRTGGSDQTQPNLTPQQVAQQILAKLDPTTSVTVGQPVTVAGESAYTLVLTPKSTSTTVSHIDIAVDANRWLPLQVQVFGAGQSDPAISLGFTGTLSFSTPSQSEFAAPQGRSEVTKTVTIGHGDGGQGQGAGSDRPVVTGTGWSTTVTIPHVDLGANQDTLNSVTTVTNLPGSPRLLTTTLVNALVYPSGKVVAGFVTPAALEAAASS